MAPRASLERARPLLRIVAEARGDLYNAMPMSVYNPLAMLHNNQPCARTIWKTAHRCRWCPQTVRCHRRRSTGCPNPSYSVQADSGPGGSRTTRSDIYSARHPAGHDCHPLLKFCSAPVSFFCQPYGTVIVIVVAVVGCDAISTARLMRHRGY